MNEKDTIISFNTETGQSFVEKDIPTAALVPEDSSILKEVMPEYDFNNQQIGDFKTAADLASSLVETCKAHRGMGLAAPQAGINARVFVMGAEDSYVAFFNPSIVLKSKKEVHMIEGCLSFPFLALRITRPEEIAVIYQDYNGVWREATYSGISARCFQHELDHLNGIVYTSKCKPLALEQGEKKRNKLMKKIGLK